MESQPPFQPRVFKFALHPIVRHGHTETFTRMFNGHPLYFRFTSMIRQHLGTKMPVVDFYITLQGSVECPFLYVHGRAVLEEMHPEEFKYIHALKLYSDSANQICDKHNQWCSSVGHLRYTMETKSIQRNCFVRFNSIVTPGRTPDDTKWVEALEDTVTMNADQGQNEALLLKEVTAFYPARTTEALEHLQDGLVFMSMFRSSIKDA